MDEAHNKYIFYIDVFSYCNLRCPSCVVGNEFGDIKTWPRGLMSTELLGRILDKAMSECEIQSVGLYNWTEPLLHPDLPSLVREVKKRNLICALSSNLNILRDPEKLLAEEPDWFRISVSGFTQPVYEIGHQEGDIGKVTNNMKRLADAKRAVGARTNIHVFYHRYLHNLDEASLMEEFARSLGFGFDTCLAQMFPVEKIIAFAEGQATDSDRKLQALFALPLDRALQITSREHKPECSLLEEIMTIDVTGNVMLCCGSSLERSNVVGQYLDYPLDEIQRMRRMKSLCGKCMKLGIPDYFEGTSPYFEAIAKETIAGHLPRG